MQRWAYYADHDLGQDVPVNQEDSSKSTKQNLHLDPTPCCWCRGKRLPERPPPKRPPGEPANPDDRFPPKAGRTGPEGLWCAVGVRTISVHRRWTKHGTGDGLGKTALIFIQIFLLSSQGKYSSRYMNSNIYYLLL